MIMLSEPGAPGRSRCNVVETFGVLAADQRAAVAEARRVMAWAERGAVAHTITGRGWACEPATRETLYDVRRAVAESLAAAVADGGLLDRLSVR